MLCYKNTLHIKGLRCANTDVIAINFINWFLFVMIKFQKNIVALGERSISMAFLYFGQKRWHHTVSTLKLTDFDRNRGKHLTHWVIQLHKKFKI